MCKKERTVRTGASILFLGMAMMAVVNLGAQVKIGGFPGPADSSAFLELNTDAVKKGLLLPRVALGSTHDTLTIARPATGLLVYAKDTLGDIVPGVYHFDGRKWTRGIVDDADVRVLQPLPGAVLQTQHDKNFQWLSVFDFMTAAQKADVQAGTRLVDVSVPVNAALSAVASRGGRLFVPAGIYRVDSPIVVPASGITLEGDVRGATVFWSATANVLLSNGGGTALRTHVFLRNLSFELQGRSGAKVLDLTCFSYSGFENLTVALRSCSGSSAVYLSGTDQGSSPYYNTFHQVYLANTGTPGPANYGWHLARHVVASGGVRGANSNLFSGGRVSAFDRSIWCEAGNNNLFQAIWSEAVRAGGVHVLSGAEAPDFTGTSSGGNTVFTLNDASAAFGVAGSLANGGVRIVSGTGSGQARKISTSSATSVTVAYPWDTIPDNTSAYEVFRMSSLGNVFDAMRAEGSPGSNFYQETLASTGIDIRSPDISSLGAGQQWVSEAYDRNTQISGRSFGSLQAFTFVLDSVPANVTNLPLVVGGSSVAHVLLPQDGSLVGICIRSQAATAGGSLTVTPAVNGVLRTGLSASLSPEVPQNRVKMLPPLQEKINGVGRFIGAFVTTQGWNPSGAAGISVTLFILPHS